VRLRDAERRLAFCSLGAARPSAEEVNDEEDHKESQQNVNRRENDVERQESNKPDNEEQESEQEPHEGTSFGAPIIGVSSSIG
jgi:hypothetical protein